MLHHAVAAKALGGVMKTGVTSVSLITDEVGPMGAGDTAYERGHSISSPKGQAK